MRRREFIVLLGGAAIAAPRAAMAQTSSRVYRLGSLIGGAPLSANTPLAKSLLNALAQRGYTLGKNLAYDARGADGDSARFRS